MNLDNKINSTVRHPIFSLNSMRNLFFIIIISELFGRYEWFIRDEFRAVETVKLKNFYGLSLS